MLVRIGIFIGSFIVIAICGYMKQKKRRNALINHCDFLVNYRNQFIQYANESDPEAYRYLNQHMTKAQDYLGAVGIIDKLRLPFENVYHFNVPVLAMLSHIASYKDNDLPYNEYARMIDDTLTRAVGDHEDAIECLGKKIHNPFYCFYIGFNAFFSLPFIAVSYMLTGENRIESNKVLRVVLKATATIVQVLGLLSALITIVVGWEDFLVIISNWLGIT